MTTTPFVVGQWVRGEKFYGRRALIDTIIRGNRNCLWLLGTRRIGKTSLLKQVELLTSTERKYGFFPVFWDFQGAESPEHLLEAFSDALLDAEERLEQLDISLRQVDTGDFFRSLAHLRRRLLGNGLRLLLLCDEVEELVDLSKKDPALLRRLRRAIQSPEDIRTVLASKIGLWALSEEKSATSPFLEGFTPPVYIQNLTEEEARSLIRQANLPDESRPRFEENVITTIMEHCNNHPYLIQLLCERYLDVESIERAIEEIAVERMVSFFFATDFEMLTKEEREVIRLVADRTVSTSNTLKERLAVESAPLSGAVHRLEHLGYIRRDAEGRFDLANYFFRRWFSELPSGPAPASSDPAEEPTVRGDSKVSTVSLEPSLGRFANRYELLESVGKGATGIVYKAIDRTLRSNIAIKVLKTEYAANAEAMERVRREILLSRDISHPNIVRVYHLGEWEGQKYLTMAWMEGPTLAGLIAKDGPFSDERTIRLSRKLASALRAAHEKDVLHRDIKPQNILTDDKGEPYLTDFGLARLLGDEGMTSQGVFLGTPNYASPEQANLLPLDGRSDVYALGVVMFEMVTGQRPFNGRTTAEILDMHRKTPPRAPQEIRHDISPHLSRVILRCLEKRPSSRFQTAQQLCRVLDRLHQGQPKRRWLQWGSKRGRESTES